MGIASKKLNQPQHITIVWATHDNRAAQTAFQQVRPTKNDSAENALSEFSLSDEQGAHPFGGNSQDRHRSVSARIEQRRPCGERRKLAQDTSASIRSDLVYDSRQARPGNRDIPIEEDHQSLNGLPGFSYVRTIAVRLRETKALNAQHLVLGQDWKHLLPACGERWRIRKHHRRTRPLHPLSFAVGPTALSAPRAIDPAQS
jgi:hypothetical protein